MEETTPAHLAAILADATTRNVKDAAVVGMNLAGIVVYWNERAEALYGWRIDEALGRNILEIVPSRPWLDELAHITAVITHGETWTGPFIVQRSDGTPIVVEGTSYPVQVDGRVVGVVGVSRRRVHE